MRTTDRVRYRRRTGTENKGTGIPPRGSERHVVRSRAFQVPKEVPSASPISGHAGVQTRAQRAASLVSVGRVDEQHSDSFETSGRAKRIIKPESETW